MQDFRIGNFRTGAALALGVLVSISVTLALGEPLRSLTPFPSLWGMGNVFFASLFASFALIAWIVGLDATSSAHRDRITQALAFAFLSAISLVLGPLAALFILAIELAVVAALSRAPAK